MAREIPWREANERVPDVPFYRNPKYDDVKFDVKTIKDDDKRHWGSPLKDEYDFVVIGAGHNSLTAANYIATAGKSVVCIENRELIGGGAMTEYLTGVPGFRHNTHSQMHGWLHLGPGPKDLEIEKYGCKYILPGPKEPQYGCVFSDETAIILYQDVDKTCESIAKISEEDAENYKKSFEKFKGAVNMLVGVMCSRPGPYSAMFTPLETTWEGRELVRMILAASDDIASDIFKNEKVKTFVQWLAVQGGIVPFLSGTGFMMPTIWASSHVHPWGIAPGGSRTLAIALANRLEAFGGTVVTGKKVIKIIIKDKRAVGVECDDGTKVMAKEGIISAAGAQQTALELVGREYLSPENIVGAENFKWDQVAVATPHIDLNEQLKWKAAKWDPDVDRCWTMAFGVDTQKELDEIYMDAMQKRLPKYPGGFLCEACLWDKSQVPDGKSAFFWWLFSTYDLEGDPKTWDYKREEILNEWIDYLRKYCTNLTDDNIISKAIYTPLDIERRTIAMRKGAMLLGDPTLDVMFYYRPWHGASHYKIEDVERLYLTGGTTHPMGGISMMCGYNCANQIAEDLNIKKWWERS